jgi:hypothetical protein
MNFKEALDPFIKSNDLIICTVAAKAESYTDEFKKGNLSLSEYKDLMNDLTILKRIDESADLLQQRISLNTAINGLIAAASLV